MDGTPDIFGTLSKSLKTLDDCQAFRNQALHIAEQFRTILDDINAQRITRDEGLKAMDELRVQILRAESMDDQLAARLQDQSPS